MKIKKIAQLCKQEGWAELVNYTDRSGCVQQWITDGRALYPVEGMPHLRAENLPSLLELNDKQKELLRQFAASMGELDGASRGIFGKKKK